MTDISFEITDGLATITLNRPEKKNALSESLLEKFPQVAEEIRSDSSVRVVLLRGAGGDFSAGIDLGFLQSMLPKLYEIRDVMRGPTPNFFQKPAVALAELPMPVIAVIEGVCIGAGLQLALGADIRFAHPEARLSIMETKWGLIPDMGISQFLPKLMRMDQAKELMTTARMIGAHEAMDVGLVTRVADDPHLAAQNLIDEIKGRSPDAVNAAKALIEKTWNMPVGEGLEIEGALQADLIGTPNQMEAVMSGMAKRPPKFS